MRPDVLVESFENITTLSTLSEIPADTTVSYTARSLYQGCCTGHQVYRIVKITHTWLLGQILCDDYFLCQIVIQAECSCSVTTAIGVGFSLLAKC